MRGFLCFLLFFHQRSRISGEAHLIVLALELLGGGDTWYSPEVSVLLESRHVHVSYQQLEGIALVIMPAILFGSWASSSVELIFKVKIPWKWREKSRTLIHSLLLSIYFFIHLILFCNYHWCIILVTAKKIQCYTCPMLPNISYCQFSMRSQPLLT